LLTVFCSRAKRGTKFMWVLIFFHESENVLLPSVARDQIFSQEKIFEMIKRIKYCVFSNMCHIIVWKWIFKNKNSKKTQKIFKKSFQKLSIFF
jgi:hypothetical protein